MLLCAANIQAQTNEKPSMLEYLSNVVLFNPSYVHVHEVGEIAGQARNDAFPMTHDILASGRWKYEIEFKNRKQDAVFTLLDADKKVLLEQKENPEQPATIIDMSSYPPGLYTIQRKVKDKGYSFEVERLFVK